MTRRVYVVTGANGHLGNMLVRSLLDCGERVISVILPRDPSGALDGLPCQRCEADVCDAAAFERAVLAQLTQIRTDDLVMIHTAGIVSITTRRDSRIEAVNVGGTVNMLDFCRKHGVRRFLYISSVHAIPEKPHGQPIGEVSQFDPESVKGVYAKSKAAATALVLGAARSGLDALVVHPSGIIGPGDYGCGHFTQLILDYMRGRLTAYVRGGYDFVDVRDVVAGILSAVERGRSGECYILSNRHVTMEELFTLLHTFSGRRAIRTVLPTWFARGTASLSELYYRVLRQAPLYTSYSLYTLQSNSLFSHAKASCELAYAPRPIAETLADTIRWLREQGRV